MSEKQQEIEQLLARSNSYRRQGLYQDNYSCSIRALELCDRNDVPPEVHCRALTSAARAAYYLSLFDRSKQFLNSLSAVLENNVPDHINLFLLESSLIKSNIFRRQGSYELSLEEMENASTQGIEEIKPELIVEKLLSEGACYFYLSRIEAAQERLESALGLSTRQKDSFLRSRVMLMLGLVAQEKGLMDMALDYYIRSGEISRRDSDYYGEAAAALNEAIVLYRRGLLDSSGERVDLAASIFDQIGWWLGLCRCRLARGNIERIRGDIEGAERFYDQAGMLAGEHQFKREAVLALICRGRLYLDREDLSGAEELVRKGLEEAGRIAPDGDLSAEGAGALAGIMIRRGDMDEAEEYLGEALRIYERLNDNTGIGEINRMMAEVSCSRGDTKKGGELFRRSADILKKTGSSFELARTLVIHAENLISRHRSSLANDAEGVGREYKNEAEFRKIAIEANHLLSSTDSELWRRRAEDLLEDAVSPGRRCEFSVTGGGEGNDVVEIRYSPAMNLGNHFVSISPPVARMIKRLELAAESSRAVLVTGETGTGKELVASMIHRMSIRSDGPFVAVNCASVPDHLFESEFFGHRRGCFTGASRERRGIFREADGGTLFLDEIGELTSVQQVKLLRVLQEGKIRPIGENREVPVDVRIVSATNQDMEEKLRNKTLRADFFYRINAEEIHIPPLRERREDIAPLIVFSLCGNGNGREKVRIERKALRFLQDYSWPGNVRELFAIMERAGHICNGGVITCSALPERIRKSEGRMKSGYSVEMRRNARMDKEEGNNLRKVIIMCNGNKTEAAKILGISRGTLYKRLKQAGLDDMINRRSIS